MRFLLPALLGLLLAGCVVSPHAPANNPVPAVLPPLEPSVISVPVTIDLEKLRSELLQQLPSPLLTGSETQMLRLSFNPAGKPSELEPGTCSVTELHCLTRKALRVVSVDYTLPVETVIDHQVFVHDLAMTMSGNQFTLTTQIEFTINSRFNSPVTQFGVASCGINEPRPRLEFTLSGYVNWGPMGDIVITPRPYTLKWLQPCNITAFQLSVEKLLDLPLLRDKLQETIYDAVFSGLRQVSLRAQLARLWPDLNAPREIQSGVWLLPHPQKVAFTEPVGHGRYVNTGILIRAKPEIVTGPRPKVAIPPVPAPERAVSGEGAYLAIRGDIALADAERLLNQKLAGKPFTVNGRVVQVESLRFYGHEDRAVLGLVLSQPVQAEIFVLGKPVFDVEKNEVRLERLRYSLETRDFLLKTANWLLGDSFRNTLQQKAVFRFDTDLAEALQEFHSFQVDVGQSMVLHGSMQRMRPQALYFTPDRLVAYVIIEGRLALEPRQK